MIKATSTKLFVSKQNPSDDDFNELEWVEVGAINNHPLEPEFTYTPLTTRVIKRTGTFTWVRKIRKPKRARFGRVIYWGSK